MFYDNTDSFENDRNYSRNTLLVVLVIAKSLRVGSLFSSYGYLRLLNYPSTFWSWLLLSGAALCFIILQQPWKGRSLSPNLWIEVCIYSIFNILQTIFYFIGLKYFGPIRTLLFTDFADITYVFMAGILFSKTREKMHLNRKRGILLLLFGYTLLFLFDTTPLSQDISNGLGATEFNLGSISISSSKMGALCLFISICFKILRKKISKTLSHNVGSTKRLNSINTSIAALMLTPFAIYSWMDAVVLSVGHYFHFFEALIFCIIVFMVINYYVDNIIKPQLRSQEAMQSSLTTAFIVCFILELWSDEITFSLLTLFSYCTICLGQYLIFKTPTTSVYSGLSNLDHPGNDTSIMNVITPLINQLSLRIKSNKDARNIFIYLCLNLLFMFVEMLYGIWNNSLGLISDGFHMLFDCIALVIGLIALVISEWQPNKTYSYGYLRVNILSGFINAIFLVFIACSVFYEAIHRFIEPPQIDNDNLLLVSVLGLLVNLVGLFVFSQAHHAAHGHSHSHGSKDEEEAHSHSGHGHSHGGHGHSHGGHEDDHEDENMKGVFLHILGDTLGSVGVIISSLCIEYFSWTISDPICSIIIACFIFTSVIPLLKSSATILLQVTPKVATKKLPKCFAKIQNLPGVQGYTEPHFWSVDGNEVVGTIHIQVTSSTNSQEVLQNVKTVFAKHNINQVTIQIDQVQEGVETLIESTDSQSNNW